MINLYKEYAIGVKKLSDAELSRETSPSDMTHIGLSERVFTFLPNTPEQRDGILIYNKSCSMVECAFSKIGNVRSTKIDTTTTNPVKSIVKQILNIASNDALDWFLVWFALDYQIPVFWLFNSNSTEYNDFSKIIDLSKQTTVYKEKSSDDEYYKILMLIRSLNKLDQLVTKKYFDAKKNLLLAATPEHRTFVHLALDYFRGANHLDPLLEYFSTQEPNTPICVTDNNKFKLSNMFINTDEQEITSRNAGHGKRWYTDPFKIAGKDYYLYVDWYPGPDRNGNDVQLMIPHFVELIHACYGQKYEYRNSQGTHELWLVNTPSQMAPVIDEPDKQSDITIIEPDENSRYWIFAPGEGARIWQLCQDKSIMVLGWGEIGDYRQYHSREKLTADMQDIYNLHDKNFMNNSLAVWQFLKNMKPGDVIYVKKGRGKVLGRGIVQSDYEYDETLDEEYRSYRRVNWTHKGEWAAPFKFAVKTLTRIGESEEDQVLIDKLERLFSLEKKPVIEQISFSIDKVIKDIDETGLIYSPSLIKRFAFSLMTKPFVILSGLAGSGKTQLAITFAKALVEDTDTQLCTVSVGADWTNREPLLGFPNALQSAQYVRPESRVLDLLIEANKDENKDKPYFLILDEMNMSYVERYFADFLSAMESKEAIPLWNGCPEPENEDDDWDDTPKKIKLPSNLFIIGTINVDETTYMFSPKVLDRANVIEFKISAEEMSNFLSTMNPVHDENIVGKAADMAADFVDIASKKDIEKDEKAIKTLENFFKELKCVNAEFGYRSATEIFRFICQAKNNDSKDEKSKMTRDQILDAAIVQKLLPKLHGSRKKLDPVLKQLWKLCFTGADTELPITDENAKKAKFKESADKIWRMYESASANGFTSFAEA